MLSVLERRDTEARQIAQTVFDRPIVLEAGAGTGKTATLVARVLAWTLGPGWELEAADESILADCEDNDHSREEAVASRVLEGVTAITFTDAAAAEMADKVARGLASVAAGHGDAPPGFQLSLVKETSADVIAGRARSLLGHLDRLEVRTIHAFCHRRLSARPLELGLHPEFRVDPELRETEETLRLVVEQRTKEAYASEEDSPLIEAAALGIGPQKLAEAVLDLASSAVPARVLDDDPFAPEKLGEICSQLGSAVDDFLTIAEDRLHAVTRGPNARKVATALEETRNLLPGLDTATEGGASRLALGLVELWSENLLNHLKKWGSGAFSGSEAASLGDRTEQIEPLCIPLRDLIRHLSSLDPERLALYRAAIAPILDETWGMLKNRGLMLFAQILIETRRLYRDHAHVLAEERARMKQLLVDEFQDTDEVQCDIVELLAFGGGEKGPGLFVVGDPKQSIYGWRNADLESYQAFLDRVRENGGETYSLVKNFRSAPVLLSEVEKAVRPVMIETPGLQPKFTELLPSEETRSSTGFSTDRWAPVESWVSCSADAIESGDLRTKQLEATQIEASAVADDIRTLKDENDLDWSQFGVLFRSTTRLDLFLEAFRRAGVPFVVTRDKQYFRRREIIDAAALVRLIVNPVDQVALLTVLRSPLFGVPDAALIPLWRRGFPGQLVELVQPDEDLRREIETIVRGATGELPQSVPGIEAIRGWEENLLHGIDTLASLRAAIYKEPADRFVERLRRTTLLEAGEAARFLGQYRVANLERFFRNLRVNLEESRGNLQAVLRSLRRSVSEALEAEEARPKDGAENAVQVMTIHKAKGLEFRHVYLVQMSAKPRSGETSSTDVDRRWGDSGPGDYSLFGARTLGFDDVRARREEISKAELVRLLYVAMTRARERLVMVGNWTEGPWQELWRGPRTFLSLLQQREDLPESILALAKQASDGPGWIDSGGIRWKFPSLTPVDSSRQARHESTALPSPAAVADASRRLRELGLEAGERMERPLIGVASGSTEEHEETTPALPDGRPIAASRSVALEVGTAIHSALEDWDLTAEIADETLRQKGRIERRLIQALDPDKLAEASSRVQAILDSLSSGSLLRRLTEQPEMVVARELPVLSPSVDTGSNAIAGISGIIDLVLRDNESDGLVVIDFKTDDISATKDLDQYAERYVQQISTYAAALQEALELPQRPRTELWFVACDRVWRSS